MSRNSVEGEGPTGIERLFTPKAIYIEEEARDAPLTREILKRYPHVPAIPVPSVREVSLPCRGLNERLTRAKASIGLARRRGRHVVPFRKPPWTAQGKDFLIHHAAGCPFDCQYCFLQSYAESPIPTLFVDRGEILREVESTLASSDGEGYFHGGQHTDFLSLEAIAPFVPPLVRLFRRVPRARLELRTKAASVESLLQLDPPANVILSWTFNPQSVIDLYEYRTSSAESRLHAARLCQEAGFRIGIRLDPIIRHEGWEKEYRELLERILEKLDPAGISSCVLGGLRYKPRIDAIIRRRFPRSRLPLGELLPGPDGTLRYFRPMRIEMYRKLVDWIGDRVRVFLCMEPEEVRRAVFQA
jgi:spore photoproduct lyase